MELTGRYVIPAPPPDVWDALNNPEVLRACIPGCEAVERISATNFLAAATLKIGPMKATFKGKVMLDEIDAPHRCVIRGGGQGGVAGFANGEAEVLLTPEGEGTLLTYAAKASVGGKLAQIGQRLIDGAAREIADDFFRRFAETLTLRKIEGGGGRSDVPPVPERLQELGHIRLPSWVWAMGATVIAAILLVLFRILW